MLTDQGTPIIRQAISTGYKFIPMDEENIDYQEYLRWKSIDGNEPEPAE
mgnify:FL=1